MLRYGAHHDLRGSDDVRILEDQLGRERHAWWAKEARSRGYEWQMVRRRLLWQMADGNGRRCEAMVGKPA